MSMSMNMNGNGHHKHTDRDTLTQSHAHEHPHPHDPTVQLSKKVSSKLVDNAATIGAGRICFDIHRHTVHDHSNHSMHSNESTLLVTHITSLSCSYPLKLMSLRTKLHHIRDLSLKAVDNDNSEHDVRKNSSVFDSSNIHMNIPSFPSLIYLVTFGGGMLSSDEVHINVRVKPYATGIITTQTSQKIYKSSIMKQSVSRQHIHSDIEENGMLCVCPDVTVPYRNSVWHQSQTFHMRSSSSLLLLDWYSSGRYEDPTRNERWAFQQFKTVNTIYIDNHIILHDAVDLNNHGIKPMSSSSSSNPYNIHLQSVCERMLHYNVVCMCVLIGPHFNDLSLRIHEHISSQLIHHEVNTTIYHQSKRRESNTGSGSNKTPFMISTSPIDVNSKLNASLCKGNPNHSNDSAIGHGVVIRMAAVNTHLISQQLKLLLTPLKDVLINAPWERP